MTDQGPKSSFAKPTGLMTRRTAVTGLAAAAGAAALLPRGIGYVQAQTSEPIRLGFQVHRTGIGAAYGRWYERTTTAAVELINANGGIAGRQIEIIAEDDGTDPKRGAEVIEKFATQHKVDVAFGTLFSHVVMGAAPRAGELKLPYFVVSEGYHVASGALNRYVFQPGITDVRAQVTSMAPWVSQNLGKKVTMIFPDYAFGHDHRDFFSAAIKAQGGEVSALIPVPPTESSFTRYLPQIPADTEVLYHVMVGPAVLTFVKELGEHFGSNGRKFSGSSTRWRQCRSTAPAWSFWKAPISGKAFRVTPAPTRRSTTSSTGRRSAWTRAGPAPPTRTTSPPIRTCSAAGRRCTSSSTRSRRAATSRPPMRTGRRWSRRPRR
jgi:branched-chain amino acid transport system substrate-binding protein